MGFLTAWRDRLAVAVIHRPVLCSDPVLGELEQIGDGLWQTVQPVVLLEEIEPVAVMVESDLLRDECAGSWGQDAFLELRKRYEGLREAIGPMICDVAPRTKACTLWDNAVLVGVEILRKPGTAEAVVGLEYQLSDDPEYTYVVRVEHWQAVDVSITG